MSKPHYQAYAVEEFIFREEPFYLPIGHEIEIFEAAYANHLPVLLKGPTGCGNDYLILGKSKTPIKPNVENETVIHHSFKVSQKDFDPSLDFLRQNGVEILRVEDRADGIFIGKSAYFHDPDGNALEIHDAQKLGM